MLFYDLESTLRSVQKPLNFFQTIEIFVVMLVMAKQNGIDLNVFCDLRLRTQLPLC